MVLAIFTVIIGLVSADIPVNTFRRDAGGTMPIFNATEAYFFGVTNVTDTVLDTYNEWGLVYGTTGNWFNYTKLNLTPVYIGLQMHPLNITYDSELVLPVVYDKDNTHWQLALYWVNGTQITDSTDLLVMYYAHVDPDNPTGLTYIDDNEEGPPE